MHEMKPLGGRYFTPTFIVCIFVIVLAGFVAAVRYIAGIGAVSNMNDGYPWGIWIAYDVVVSTAFACGGYVMALTVYVLNNGRYHPLVRPALLASMFGYCLAGVSVMVDIGRYLNVWRLYLPGINPHSAMLEVALCITTYCFVMIFEFAPTFVEKWNLKKTGAILDKFIFLLIGLGVLLPTMHQSSLGTMMILAGQKLSPLWHTNMLPLFFLFSALFMGFAMVVFEGTISSRVYKLGDETDMLSKIGRAVGWIIAVYLILRFQDVFARGALGEAFSGNILYACMFWLENLLLAGGMFIMFRPRMRTRPGALFLAAVLILCGGALYRFNCYIIGYDPGTGWKYFPSVGEQIITYGLIATELAGYMLFVKYFPVFTAGHKSAASHS